MKTIDKVRAEIEKQITSQKGILRLAIDSAFVEGAIDALQGILAFIASIEDNPDPVEESPIDPFDTIRLFTDINLIQELRRRGYEVTCKKTIEL